MSMKNSTCENRTELESIWKSCSEPLESWVAVLKYSNGLVCCQWVKFRQASSGAVDRRLFKQILFFHDNHTDNDWARAQLTITQHRRWQGRYFGSIIDSNWITPEDTRNKWIECHRKSHRSKTRLESVVFNWRWCPLPSFVRTPRGGPPGLGNCTLGSLDRNQTFGIEFEGASYHLYGTYTRRAPSKLAQSRAEDEPACSLRAQAMTSIEWFMRFSFLQEEKKSNTLLTFLMLRHNSACYIYSPNHSF